VLCCNNFGYLYFFVLLRIEGGGAGYGMAGGCFTDVVVHISKNYYQEHATELRRQPKDVADAWGAVIFHFYGVSNLYK